MGNRYRVLRRAVAWPIYAAQGSRGLFCKDHVLKWNKHGIKETSEEVAARIQARKMARPRR